ncbi:MAG: hypothetical protein SRB2_01056 [Desulfobacteraceae bacterium Eth-SRB2]|nr:MAG: hypothetical protein SRB2_01056 [Desulfobacteraceae bacterium Eth-SRB2]
MSHTRVRSILRFYLIDNTTKMVTKTKEFVSSGRCKGQKIKLSEITVRRPITAIIFFLTFWQCPFKLPYKVL